MTQRRTGDNRAALIEALRPNDKLRTGVSPEGVRFYDEKRPDYVESRGWYNDTHAKISRALSSYVPELNRWAAVAEQRQSQQDNAAGISPS